MERLVEASARGKNLLGRRLLAGILLVRPMPVFTNIAAYKFANLADLKPLREKLVVRCKAWGLKGTILLSPEGINLFMAGGALEIEELLSLLRSVPGLEALAPKYSESDHQPFTRMLVRLKKEIIAFGVEGISPADHTSPKLTAQTLKQWLDEGRPITLLDTRNDYEVKLGTFKGALPAGIDHFREFPEAVRKLPAEMKKQPIVMFCTGGIRCEKAGPFMEREGFEQIYQLDGGILKYFEECGADHYEGECFVFDQRVGVDPSLRETDSALCFACQTPLDQDDQKDSRFIRGESCPYCYKTTEQQQADVLVRRHASISSATQPLPGSVPYENRRPLNVPGDRDGQTLLEMVSGLFPHIDREEWVQRCAAGRFLNEAGQPMAADTVVQAGDRCVQIFPGEIEPDVNPDIRILHEDEALIVLHKPAPLPMHPGGRFNRNTVQFILNEVYAPQQPRFVHRLDANTTGLVLCARTRHFAALLQQQFLKSQVEKVYLVKALGHPPQDRFIGDAPISADPGPLGSYTVDEEGGQASRTDFAVLRRDADGTTLLEARPITGRTNQIRVHLWHLGFPIVGDPTYLPGRILGESQTLEVSENAMSLHAWKLGFNHPVTGARLAFETDRPGWTL